MELTLAIGKRQLVAECLHRSAALRGVGHLRRRALAEQLIIFNYHRIRPDDAGFEANFEQDVYDTDASTFAAQMRWLKANTEVISLSELLRRLAAPRPRPRPAALLTFDDGYIDNFTIAYPILRELELPATLFVPTQLIEQRMVGWWDIIAYLVRRCVLPSIQVQGQAFELPAQAREAASFVQEQIKHRPHQQGVDLVQQMAQACQVEPPPAELMDREMMTWDQIRQVAADNFTIGSHTHTHRVLSTLDAAAQEHELRRSKELLEQRLGQPVVSIAYPVGERQFLARETAPIARRCGYEVGFTYLTGVNRWSSVSRYCISRVAGPGDLASLAAMTVLPELFSW